MIGAYYGALVNAIESQGHTAQIIPRFYSTLDWGDTNRFYLDFAPKGSCVVCHASFQFTSLVAEDSVWVPGTYSIGKAVDCTSYFQHFADCLLNNNHEIMSLEELIRRKEAILRSYGVDGQIFVRPNSGSKLFAGRLFSAAELNLQKFLSEGAAPQSVVVISRPKGIRREWRFIIADQRVIAASMYKEFNEIRISSDVSRVAMDYANAIASREFQPARVWVLDTCETMSGEMFVVEINGFSSSNWYGCDVDSVVASVSCIALDDWNSKTSQSK